MHKVQTLFFNQDIFKKYFFRWFIRFLREAESSENTLITEIEFNLSIWCGYGSCQNIWNFRCYLSNKRLLPLEAVNHQADNYFWKITRSEKISHDEVNQVEAMFDSKLCHGNDGWVGLSSNIFNHTQLAGLSWTLAVKLKCAKKIIMKVAEGLRIF